MRTVPLLFLLLLFTPGCTSRDASPPDDLVRLADAHVAVMRYKARLRGTDSTVAAQHIADSLAAHGFTKESFEREMLVLVDSPNRLRQFNDLLTARTK